MITDSRQQFEAVRELDEVVVRPQAEGFGLDLGFLFGREDDHRRLSGGFVFAKVADQGEAVDVGHHQILENHGGLDLGRSLDGLGGVLAVMEDDIVLAREHPPDGLTDDRLVVDQENGRLVLGQCGLEAHGREAPGMRCDWLRTCSVMARAIFEIGRT